MSIETFAGTAPKTWDDVERYHLAPALPGYQARPQQQLLAHSIEAALEHRNSLLAQAGCGTGKSIGGMVPIILHAVRNRERVVVATATKALQEQYWNSDVPFLLQNSGISFTAALLKGRSNYICRAKLVGEEAERLEFLPAVVAELDADPTHDGDREHFQTPLEDQDWAKISTSSNECPGKRECPFGEVCLAERAKQEAKEADLVITNTSMAMMDAAVRLMTADRDEPVEMLGHYKVILFDEAHEIPEYASGALGFDFTARGMGSWATKAQSFCALQGEDISHLTDRFAAALAVLEAKLLPLSGKSLTQAWFVENFEPFADLLDEVREIREAVYKTSITRDPDGQQPKRKFLLVQGEGIDNKLTQLMNSEDYRLVRWVETYETRRGDKSWKLCASPVDVAPFLREAFWGPEAEKTAILMSATLSSGRHRDGSADFSYLRRTLGLEDADAVDVGTPFDFPNQALMFVPGPKVANPKSDRAAWMAYAATATLAMVEAAKGGALLLFTSRTAMQEAWDAMAESLEMAGYTTLMQGNRTPGRQHSNKELARIFKEDTHSVLFALKSFFVGVDVPGDACRLVIIDKLPFPVPSDPIFAARALAEEKAGRRSFNSLSIPMMTLTLEQGIGRLIRRVTDTGVVSILDSRLTSTGYGRQIVHNLPNFPVTTELDDVRKFFANRA